MNRSIYANLDNELQLIANTNDCNKFIVKTDNGTIVPSYDNCKFRITPSRIGIAHITISEKNSKKTLDSFVFRVFEIPDPVVIVANKHGGEIDRKILEIQAGLIVQNDMFRSFFTVTSYIIEITRNDSTIFRKKCIGNRFDDEIKRNLQNLKPNDRILFSNITYKGIANNGYLQPIEFRIIE